MQVIIFDKKFKCLYRLRNIPNDGNFRQVYKAIDLCGDIKDYDTFRLTDFDELCIDEYTFNGKELQLTAAKCN